MSGVRAWKIRDSRAAGAVARALLLTALAAGLAFAAQDDRQQHALGIEPGIEIAQPVDRADGCARRMACALWSWVRTW